PSRCQEDAEPGARAIPHAVSAGGGLAMSGETIMGCVANLEVETLSAWRDQALPEPEAQRVAEHLPACDACRQRLSEYEAVARALRTLSIPEPISGYGHNPRLRREHARSSARPRGQYTTPRNLGAIAAVLLLAVLAGALFQQLRSSRPQVSSHIDTFALHDAG